MTLEQIPHYLEVGAAMAAAIGIIGHAIAALPWAWAKTIGNVLNAVSVDFQDLKNASKNAKAAVEKKSEEAK